MKTLVVLSLFLLVEFASAQQMIGEVMVKSWRTRSNGEKRDVKILSYSTQGENWYRLPEKIAQQLKVGKVCLFEKTDAAKPVFCQNKNKTIYPITVLPYLDKLFVGQDEEKKGEERKDP